MMSSTTNSWFSSPCLFSASSSSPSTITSTATINCTWTALFRSRHARSIINDDQEGLSTDMPHLSTGSGGSQPPVCMGMGDVAIAMILVILIVTTIVGNILVVLSIAVYRRMRTFTNVLLVSLASADLLVGIMVMPIALVDQLHRRRWQFGFLLCKLWTTIDVLLCTASILNLCVISLDRYFAITAPLRYTRTRSQTLAVGIVIGVWLVSLVISSPPWFVPQWSIQVVDETCGYAKATAYRIYSAFGSFYIPLFIMLFVYFKIFRVASTREKVLNSERRGSRTMQMWQQQATRRAARNSLAANASIGASLALTKSGSVGAGGHGHGLSTASSRSAPGRVGMRQYDVMQPVDETSDPDLLYGGHHGDDEEDDDGYGGSHRSGGRRARISYRGHSIDAENPRRKRTPESTTNNSYYRHVMNRCESPAALKHVKFAGDCAGGGGNPGGGRPQRGRMQRTPTEELMMDSELGTSWRGGGPERNTTTMGSYSDLTTTGAATLGGDGTTPETTTRTNARKSSATTTTALPCTGGSTSQPNDVPLLAEHARGYFEKTVPWSLVRKANEYYVNSKPIRPSREKLIYLKERKALKTIGIVVSGFIICWLPFFILYLIEAACETNEDIPTPSSTTTYSSYNFVTTPISSASRPVVARSWNLLSQKLNTSSWHQQQQRASSPRGYHQNAYVVAMASAAAAADYSAFAALSPSSFGGGGSSSSSSSSSSAAASLRSPTSSTLESLDDTSRYVAHLRSHFVSSFANANSNNANNGSGTDSADSDGSGSTASRFLVCAIPEILADLFLWLGYSNSVLNPLIYTFYNRDFRRCFKDLLSGGCLRRNAANRRMSVRRLHQTRL